MLLHYYTHSILFWLGLPNFKPNEDLTKNLQSLDFEYLPREVCIAKCLKRTQMEMLSEMEQQVGVEKVTNKTSLQICRDSCTTMNATPQEAKGAATSTAKQIHENYSLNLICRDDSSLHFLIDLHKVNKGKNKKFMKRETDITTSSEPTTTATYSPSSASSSSSLTSDDFTLASTAYKEEHANVNGGSEGSEEEEGKGVKVGNEYGTLFVIKIHLANDADNVYAYLSDDNFFTIDKLMANTTYNISVVAVHSNNKYSVIAQQQQFVTLRRSYTPGNVTEIKVTNFVEDQVNKMHLSATMMWKPPADMTCHYDIICFSPESEEYDLQPLEIRNPRQLYTYQLENLTFSSVYKVGIRARNTKNMKESELFWKTFQAPSCVEWYNYNFNICAPDAPQNLHIEQTYVDQYLYSLNISWNLPTHLPDNYTLRIQDLSPQGQLDVYNLTKELHNFFLPQVAIYGVFFEVSLTAYTRGGQSTSTFTDFTKTIVHMPEKNPFVKLIAVILAPIFCVAILSLTIFMIYHRRAKLKRYQERCKYFEELEKKAPIDPKDNFDFRPNNKIVSNELLQYQLDLDEMALFNDEMEIDRNQLTLHEVLGEGAFGLVKRGIYTDTKLGSVLEVAVKMLKDHPSTDDVRAFRREIEVMKSVEKHPNIVGIIGHCTRYGSDMMLLTEYCSFGNLLNFLRDEWRFLHELQQKKQILTTSIVDVELPHVTKAQQQQQKGLYGGIQFKYDNIHKMQTTTTTTATHATNDDDSGGGEGYQLLNKTMDEGAAATTELQKSIKDYSAAVDIEELNTMDDDVIERFKRKYNDFIATAAATTEEQQNYVINSNHNNNNHIKLYKSKEDLQHLKNLNNETLSQTHPAIQPSDDKILMTHVSNDQQTTGATIPATTTPAATTTATVILSPATENKSYGYHGCCTNSCKCDVDVIKNIDSTDSSKDNEELDRLLQQRQQQHHQQHRHHQQHQFQELQTQSTTTCCTTIEIKNCDCKMKEQIVPIKPNLKQTKQHDKEQEQHYPQHFQKHNNKRNAAVENKTYFKIFNSEKYYLTRKQRLMVTDDKETLQQSSPAPPPLPLQAKVKRKSKPPPLPLLPPPPTPPRPVTITTSTTTKTLSSTATTTTINDDWAATFNRVPLAAGDLLDIARQVAVGMDFLAKNKVVHRDLAARNVLVAPDRTVKIADFGLSRDVYQENMYKKTGNGKLPIKWLALESMTHQVYTTQSDVWSYGVLLYEIVTLGATPYPSIPTNRLLHLLKTGYRMEKPKNCGQEFYDLMYSCWNGVPNERPTFHEIIKKLDNMLNNLHNTSNSTASNATDESVTATIIPDDRDYIKEDNDLSKQESPIQQICSDDSYLKPL